MFLKKRSVAVGVNSEIVYLGMNGALYQFDIKHKVAKKVYEITQEDNGLVSLPFRWFGLLNFL
jgi:hypothetical protein